MEQYLGFFHRYGFLDFLDLGDQLGFDLGSLVEVLCRDGLYLQCRDGLYLHTMAVTGFLLLYPLRHVDAEEIWELRVFVSADPFTRPARGEY